MFRMSLSNKPVQYDIKDTPTDFMKEHNILLTP